MRAAGVICALSSILSVVGCHVRLTSRIRKNPDEWWSKNPPAIWCGQGNRSYNSTWTGDWTLRGAQTRYDRFRAVTCFHYVFNVVRAAPRMTSVMSRERRYAPDRNRSGAAVRLPRFRPAFRPEMRCLCRHGFWGRWLIGQRLL